MKKYTRESVPAGGIHVNKMSVGAMNNNGRVGKIVVFTGPMFAGKTSRLISEYRRQVLGGRRSVIIRNPLDVRYSHDSVVTTHDTATEQALTAKHPTNLFLCGLTTGELIMNYDVVLIDEGQFYEDVDSFCDQLADSGVTVYCATLIGDYMRRPYPAVSRLLACAEEIIHMKAVDRKTGEDAAFTSRIVSNDTPTLVGADGVYEAVSRKSLVAKNVQRDSVFVYSYCVAPSVSRTSSAG